MSIAALLKKAEAATPAKRFSRWTQYAPVVEQLSANGYSTWGAVKWLVEQGEVQAAEQRTAYNTILHALKAKQREAGS